MKKLAIGTAVLLLICFQSAAQFRCGFDAGRNNLQRLDPAYQKNAAQLNTLVQRYATAQNTTHRNDRFTPLSVNTVYIPVVVHVIHTGGALGSTYNPTDATIRSAINYLNAVYDGTWTGSGGSIQGVGDVQIRFVLATRDPSNNATTGINRINAVGLANYNASGVRLATSSGAPEIAVKNLSRWDPYKYYNIWLVNKIDGCNGLTGCPSFTAGYAYFPVSGFSPAIARDSDGTVMLASQMVPGQKTLPHELGHAFYLYHPFEGETNQPNVNGCPSANPALGDGCADTAPITNPADDGASSPFACRTGANPCGGTYNSYTESNFMNYTTCYRLFTPNQKDRMQAAATVTMRASLASSWANNQGSYPLTWTPPVAAVVTPVSVDAVSNVTGILSVSLNNRTVHSLNATQDGGYVNGANKWYNLFDLETATTYTLTVWLYGTDYDPDYGPNYDQVGVFLDLDGNGVFNNTNEQLFYADDIPQTPDGVELSFDFTTPATASARPLRLRIIQDLATGYGLPAVTGATNSLEYGQAEDYPVFIAAPVVLPAELTRFEGAKLDDGIRLSWVSAAESGLESYELERSADGHTFSSLASVLPKGPSTYSYDDKALRLGNWHYRLKMQNTDGTFSYSRVINFNYISIKAPVVLTNPFTDHIDVVLPQGDKPYTCRLMDVAGRVLHRSGGGPTNGTVRLSLHGKNLSAGMYLLAIEQENKIYTVKLIK